MTNSLDEKIEMLNDIEKMECITNNTKFDNYSDDKPQTPYWKFKDSFKENYFEFNYASKTRGMEAMFRDFDKEVVEIAKKTNDLIHRDIATIVNNWLELDKKDIAIMLSGLNTFYKEETDGSKKLYIPLVYITREDYYDEVYWKSHWNMPKSTKFGEVCLEQKLSEVVLDTIRQTKMLLDRNEFRPKKKPKLKDCDNKFEESENSEMSERLRKRR